jgi:signal transduction histidine kinase
MAVSPLDSADRSDRAETNQSLEAERNKADELLDEALGAVQQDAEAELRAVRAEIDARLDRQTRILPEVSEKLEDVAQSLASAASSLTGAADTIKGSVGAEKDLAALTERLTETAGALSSTAAAPPRAGEVPADIVQEMADAASEMAAVTAALADERIEADQQLEIERSATDRVMFEQVEQAQILRERQLDDEQGLSRSRRETDEHLAAEREHTDTAIDRVLELLAVERREHAVTGRKVASRNEFLAIVSHDLRTPLTTIQGLASLIGATAARRDLGGELQDWSQIIERSVLTMDRLIGDLLDFASLEDGRLRVVAAPHDLSPLIRRVVDAFRPEAAGKSIALGAETPAEPMTAVFDEDRIYQVLSNLIHNAIKFTRPRGSIRLRALDSGPEVLVVVSDTGIGIPAEEVANVFERFRRLDVRQNSGLGLGLYISKWIVESHRGRIWVDSKPGAGSTFYFTLPKA